MNEERQNIFDKTTKALLAPLKGLYRAWDSFWFSDIDPHPIAAFRILFALYLLICFLCQLPHVEVMFSNQGIYSPFLIPDIAPPPWMAWGIHLLLIACTVCLMIGWKSRWMAPIILIIFLYYYLLTFSARNSSYDRLIMLFLLLMSLGGQQLDKAFSISKSNTDTQLVSAWFKRLMCVQVTLFYFGTGYFKLFLPHWQDEQMLPMTMSSLWATPAAFWLLSLNLPIWFFELMTKAIIGFELSCGFLFWIRHVQKIAFILGIIFHLSVWIFLSIPQLFMLCPLTYVLFMPADELKSIGTWISNFSFSKRNPQ